MILFLKRIAVLIRRNKSELSNYDVDKQAKFISSFSHPKDDIERSYFQYKCQMKLMGNFTASIYTLASMALFLFYRIRLTRIYVNEEIHDVTGLFLYNSSEDIVPESIKSIYVIKQITKFQERMALTEDDVNFLDELNKRYPLSWYFRLKCMLKISIYSYYIRKYQPKAIIVSEEYSFTSSVLTFYCERFGIEHINVMHGEKLYDMTDAFFHFHKCYVWEEHYRDLFISLGAEPSQFVVEPPPSQQPCGCQIEKTVDYTYYLGGEKKNKLIAIANTLEKLLRLGYVVAIRPHPRYNNYNEVKKIFIDYIVEDTTLVSVHDSVLRTKNAISFCSTVLRQAKVNGVNVVVDDLTNPSGYNQLLKMRYCIVAQSHNKLSEVLIRAKKSVSDS